MKFVFFDSATPATGKETLQTLYGAVPTVSIICQLLLTDVAHIKIPRGGMCKDKPARGSMGNHHPILRQPDAYALQRQKPIEVENQTLVGHGGIAHGRAYLSIDGFWLKAFEQFVMHSDRCRLCQTVKNGLAHHFFINVLFPTSLFRAMLRREAASQGAKLRIATRTNLTTMIDGGDIMREILWQTSSRGKYSYIPCAQGN